MQRCLALLQRLLGVLQLVLVARQVLLALPQRLLGLLQRVFALQQLVFCVGAMLLLVVQLLGKPRPGGSDTLGRQLRQPFLHDLLAPLQVVVRVLGITL